MDNENHSINIIIMLSQSGTFKYIRVSKNGNAIAKLPIKIVIPKFMKIEVIKKNKFIRHVFVICPKKTYWYDKDD